MNVSLKEYKEGCDYYRKQLSLIDDVLYRLCREYPEHSKKSSIHAKLWIIGRTYASGIERLGKSTNEQGGSLTSLAEHLYKNRKTVDAIFKRLATIKEPLNKDKLKVIVQEHGRFVKLLSLKLRKNRSARSFASKYMHFHCPSVPLYDSYASNFLRSAYRWNDNLVEFKMPASADEDYYAYVCRFWQLYQYLKAKGKEVTVKLIDNYVSSMI